MRISLQRISLIPLLVSSLSLVQLACTSEEKAPPPGRQSMLAIQGYRVTLMS